MVIEQFVVAEKYYARVGKELAHIACFCEKVGGAISSRREERK
jgi:hypothetical protein